MATASPNTEFAARQGFQLIDNVEVEIGGQCIDKHYGEWMDIWAQLSHSRSKLRQLNRLVGGAGDVKIKTNYMYHYNSGFAKTQVLHFLLLHFNITKLRSMFNLSNHILKN